MNSFLIYLTFCLKLEWLQILVIQHLEIELFVDKILLLCNRATLDLHAREITHFLSQRQQVFCIVGFIKGKKLLILKLKTKSNWH